MERGKEKKVECVASTEVYVTVKWSFYQKLWQAVRSTWGTVFELEREHVSECTGTPTTLQHRDY